jgi:hypothetical protein
MIIRRLWLLVLVLLAAPALFAQDPVQFEVTLFGGLPITNTIKSNICCSGAVFGSEQVRASPYLAGGSAGVLLNDRIRIDFGAVYLPYSYDSTVTFCCPVTRPTTTRRGHAWEMPLLAAYRWKYGSLRPFAGGGFVLFSELSPATGNESSGPVIRGGFDWEFSRLSIRPEFRLIHFGQAGSSVNQSISRTSVQLEALIGVSFRIGISH